jgi:hypothetical protein
MKEASGEAQQLKLEMQHIAGRRPQAGAWHGTCWKI